RPSRARRASTTARTPARGFSTGPTSSRVSAQGGSGAAVESRLAQPAVRAVADVETDELIAAPAHAQVLGRAQQRRVRGGERQQPRNGLELLAGVAVAIDVVGVGCHDALAP